jgi:uncharacterized protein YutE (UPF0331/DUF86 family)
MIEDLRIQRYREKLEKLEEYRLLFSKWFYENSLQNLEAQDNFQKIFAIYHTIQLMVEVITDIVSMMLKDSSLIVEDNYSNFKKLLKRDIISSELFQGLKELNGLRNRIVHDYNGLIDDIAWKSIEKNKKYIDKFKKVVKKWLDQNK